MIVRNLSRQKVKCCSKQLKIAQNRVLKPAINREFTVNRSGARKFGEYERDNLESDKAKCITVTVSIGDKRET